MLKFTQLNHTLENYFDALMRITLKFIQFFFLSIFIFSQFSVFETVSESKLLKISSFFELFNKFVNLGGAIVC